MQNTLPLTPGNPLRNITGLARQIALPGEHQPLRFPSFPALERTAVMGFNQPATITLPAAKDSAITVFRQATYPVWADREDYHFQVIDYRFVAMLHGTTTDTCSQAPLSLLNWTLVNRTASSSHVGLAGIGSLSYTYPMFGRDDKLPGVEFVYVPAGCKVDFVCGTNSATAFNMDITIERWRSPGQSTLDSSIEANKSSTTELSMLVNWLTTPNSVGEWYRIAQISVQGSTAASRTPYVTMIVSSPSTLSFVASTSTQGLLTSTGSTKVVHHWPIAEPAEFKNSTLPWYAVRTTAAALLGTNVTKIMNKGGTILAGRVSPAVLAADQCTATYIAGLHPAEKAFLPLETGIYTYCPPSTDLVFFADYTLNTSGLASTISAPLFQLTSDAMYNRAYLNPGTEAASMACTVSWHIEFRTSSALFQVGLSAMTLEALHAAQLVLVEHGFFFENPEHEKLISRLVGTAKKYAPSVIGTVNPVAGKLLQSVIARMGKRDVVPKPGPSKPKATSASGSGLTKPAKPAGKGSQRGRSVSRKPRGSSKK